MIMNEGKDMITGLDATPMCSPARMRKMRSGPHDAAGADCYRGDAFFAVLGCVANGYG
jgi:hypothetical protein